MSKQRDYVAIATIILLMITSIVGILSLDFSHGYNFINQYGHTVKIYGYGVYAFDTFFQAPISIGTDMCILFILVPLFIYTYRNFLRRNDKISALKLISVYAVAFYYAASIVLGLTYNPLFLVYVALFSCSLFGMYRHIINIKLEQRVMASKGLRLFLILSGIALFVAWLPDILASLIKGTTLSIIGVYTTGITYVLDMGIVSPIFFICLYFLVKREPLGTLLLAILLKLCIVIGIMMIPQTLCLLASGYQMSLPEILIKSVSFILLGAFAFYFNKDLYRQLEAERNK